jgi:hypothetical protein
MAATTTGAGHDVFF